MTSVTLDPLEKVIRDAGEGWLVDWYAPREEAISHLRMVLRQADNAARERLGDEAPRLTPDALIEEYAQNPHKVRAFLQVIGSVASPHILVMVWRVLHGAEIAKIRMEYDGMGPFRLFVSVISPDDDATTEEYESNDIDDAVVLRHLGTIKMGSKGTFDGFYALSLNPGARGKE